MKKILENEEKIWIH